MTSAQRLYLDRLWWSSGVDPRSDTAQVIELRIRLATLHEIAGGFADLKRALDTPTQ